jgi:hypothetical protein
MADERWYGSMITLPDGRLVMLGGSTPYGALRGYQDPAAAVNAGTISMTPELYEPGSRGPAAADALVESSGGWRPIHDEIGDCE